MTSDYKVYKTRWLFLLTLALLNTICFLIGVSFSPVATLVTQYYQIDGDRIDLLVLTACGIHVLGIFVSIYCIGRFHILIALRYASTMAFIGGLIRATSTLFKSDFISPKVT